MKSNKRESKRTAKHSNKQAKINQKEYPITPAKIQVCS